MENKIARNFNLSSLLKFAFPSIMMMMFTSLYTIVDGIFVSRFVGTAALSAINIVYPVYNIIIAIGVMLASGGSAVIAKNLGEGKNHEAKSNFTLITIFGVVVGLAVMIAVIMFGKPLFTALGANENIIGYCLDYAYYLIGFTPLMMLQLLFQYFFITAGKPILGLVLTVVAGLTNVVLDYIFIVPLGMGIAGAALATGIGISIPAVYGFIYFSINKKSTISYVKPKFNGKVILATCSNGSSEMVSNIALAVVTFLFNIIMMRLLGEDGVAAITILMYAQFLINAVFMGFSMGVAPVFSYNYGCQNMSLIKKIFKYCLWFVIGVSVIMFVIFLVSAPTIIRMFAPMGSNVYNIAMSGFVIFSLNFLFAGINIFTSALFTAFSNGKVSAIISFLRTFVFISAGLLLLPSILGLDGVWAALFVAEFLAMIVCVWYLTKLKKKYGYE